MKMLLFLGFLVGFAAPTSAQQFSIAWFKIAGGGGASAGGQYALHGTIAQHEAGATMTQAQYSLMGGFWALPQAIQVTGAPSLAITAVAPGFATLSWTPGTPGFVLQESANLNEGWTNSVSGAANPITVPISPPGKF